MTYCFNPFTEIFPLMVLNETLFTSFLVLHISLLSSPFFFVHCCHYDFLSFLQSTFSYFHHFTDMLLHTLFIPPKRSPFFPTYFLNFHHLIYANMYYLLKKFLSKQLIKLLPPQSFRRWISQYMP